MRRRSWRTPEGEGKGESKTNITRHQWYRPCPSQHLLLIVLSFEMFPHFGLAGASIHAQDAARGSSMQACLLARHYTHIHVGMVLMKPSYCDIERKVRMKTRRSTLGE